MKKVKQQLQACIAHAPSGGGNTFMTTQERVESQLSLAPTSQHDASYLVAFLFWRKDKIGRLATVRNGVLWFHFGARTFKTYPTRDG